MTDLLLDEPIPRVVRIRLNRPDRLNALIPPMLDELKDTLDRIGQDRSVRAVVLTGAGRGFCAGADLGDLGKATGQSMRAIYEGFLRVARSTLPTVAAVNGAAVGAGMNLALSCDVRVAARRARFDTRFVDLGLHPGGGHTWLLRRAVGDGTARTLVLFGQALDGEAAERVGLAWRCVDDDAVVDEAVALAERAASGPKELVAEVKRSFDAMAGIDEHDAAVDRELEPQLWSVTQPWFAERLAALQAKISKR